MPVPIATEEDIEEEPAVEFEPIVDDGDDLDSELELGYADSDIGPWESLLKELDSRHKTPGMNTAPSIGRVG